MIHAACCFLLQHLHQLFGMHDFHLVETKRGYKARCRCGVYLKKAPR